MDLQELERLLEAHREDEARMIDLKPPFRRATPADALALAELANFAGDGLPLYIWERYRAPRETAWQHGRRRAARDGGGFSYNHAVVAEIGGKCAACLLGYPQPEEADPIDYGSMPRILAPLRELETLAPATWYVNIVAAYPESRNQGLGTRLLAIAEDIARENGMAGLSIIVSDANHGARRLFLRNGFSETGTRPKVKEGWPGEGRDWVLLTKHLGTR
jgi:ribosomal protein S18 acetylase RimI-like enzyme